MTIGEYVVAYSETCVTVCVVGALLWFFYNGHGIARRFIRFTRNIASATAQAFNRWVDLFDESIFGKDDNNGCKDM